MVSPLFSNSYLSPASHQGGQFCHDEEGAQPAVPVQLRDTMPKARRSQAETRAGSRAGFFFCLITSGCTSTMRMGTDMCHYQMVCFRL